MYYVTYSMSYTVLYFESFEAMHECSRKTYKETKRLLLQALDKIDAKEPFLGCQIGCTSDKALRQVFKLIIPTSCCYRCNPELV